MRRRIPWLLPVLVLSGCEASMFRHAPMEAESAPCPAELVGAWQDVDSTAAATVRVQVDENCQADIAVLQEGAWLHAHTRLRSVDGHLFVWARDVTALIEGDMDESLPEGFFAWRIRIEGDQLHLHDSDTRLLAHLVIDREVKGRVRKDEGLQVLVEEPAEAMAGLLARHAPFRAESDLSLRRVAEIADSPPP